MMDTQPISYLQRYSKNGAQLQSIGQMSMLIRGNGQTMSVSGYAHRSMGPRGGPGSNSSPQQQQYGPGAQGESMRDLAASSSERTGSAKTTASRASIRKANRQAAIQQWLSYERKAVSAGLRPARKAAMQERSVLSQTNPEDEHRPCLVTCLSFLRCGSQPVFLPPEAGEDVCGLCHDNKPLLQMQPCGHRTCLLCAKSLCYMLDMQQLVLCPYCGSLVCSFGLS